MGLTNLLGKKIARTLIFPPIVNLGFEKFWRNRAEHSILNIMYHGVVSENSNYFFPLHIVAEQFEKHLQYLSREFEIISVSEAFELYKNNIKPKRKKITISFDDGYKNNLDVALPLLEKYNTRATIFVSTVCTEKRDPPILWAHAIACLNFFFENEVVKIGNLSFKNLIEISSKIHLMDFLKHQSPSNRDKIVDRLLADFDLQNRFQEIPKEVWALMTNEELQKLAESPLVDIGSHGHLHYNLGNIDIADACADMEKSKILLEIAINKDINIIAYPDGSYSKSGTIFKGGGTEQLKVEVQVKEVKG